MGLKESGLRGSLRSTSSVLPAFFDVTITNTNSPVQEGDILTVDYSADNTGDAQDTQDIRLEIDSVEEDRDSDITLLGAQSTTGSLEWDTTDEDETTYTATVLSDDDTDSVTVEIESAIPDSVIDNFGEELYEDESRTLSDYYRFGSNADQQRTTDNAKVSTHLLELVSDERSTIWAHPDDDNEDLNNYASQGDDLLAIVRTGGAEPCFTFNIENSDSPGGYFIRLDDGSNNLALERIDDLSQDWADTRTTLETESASISGDTHYWLEVSPSWDGDTEITGDLYETVEDDGIERGDFIASISATDDTYQDELGHGFTEASTGSGGGFDEISILD